MKWNNKNDNREADNTGKDSDRQTDIYIHTHIDKYCQIERVCVLLCVFECVWACMRFKRERERE